MYNVLNNFVNIILGWLELYKLVESKDPSQTSDISDMTIILGRELTLPAGIAKSVAKPLVDMHEAWIKSENERVASEEALKKAAIAAKKAEEEARLAAKKASLDAFLKSTPITITSG